MNTESPEPTAQPLEHLVARNGMNFSTIDLNDPTIDLDSPSLLDVNVRVGWTIEGFNQGEGELRSLGLGELGGPFLQIGKCVRHTTPQHPMLR
jgi:hypothetical protein